MKLRYFAYGSNMSIARLRGRVPSARSLGCCRLAEHDLRFHKAGRDGSAKCDAYYTGRKQDFVHGVLYQIDALERPVLDMAEGLGRGYREKDVTLIGSQGEALAAFTYEALQIDATMKPFSWYLNHVLVGARESGLPLEYIARIEAVSSIEDHDREREAREREVHLPAGC